MLPTLASLPSYIIDENISLYGNHLFHKLVFNDLFKYNLIDHKIDEFDENSNVKTALTFRVASNKILFADNLFLKAQNSIKKLN